MAAKETVQEFTVRIPTRQEGRNYHIMKFNASLKVDAKKWTQVSEQSFSANDFLGSSIDLLDFDLGQDGKGKQ